MDNGYARMAFYFPFTHTFYYVVFWIELSFAS